MRNVVVALAAAMTCAAPLAFADEVPTLDVRKSCRVDVQASADNASAATCMADEQRARQTLVSQWTTFSTESRSNCGKLVTDIAGVQSYVELLTCLQMAKFSNSLPKN